MKSRFSHKRILSMVVATALLIGGIFGIVNADEVPVAGKIEITKSTTTNYENKTNDRGALVSLQYHANPYSITGEVPEKLDIVVVFDQSGSMDEKIGGTGPSRNSKRIDEARKALGTFVSNMLDKNTTENDYIHIGIVGFSTNKNDTQNLTNSKVALANYISNKLESNSGGTNLQQGIEGAKEIFARAGARSDAKKILIIMTDGMPTFYTVQKPGNRSELCGTGDSDDVSFFDSNYCNVIPSEAAKISLDKFKQSNTNADVYTIVFGDEKAAAEKLNKINNTTTKYGNNNPIYENKTALSSEELLEIFTKTVENTIETIGKNAKVEDTIPATFKLSAQEKQRLINLGIEVKEQADGTTKLTWKIGDIVANRPGSLSYEVIASEDYHGSMYTNVEATFTADVEEQNPAYTSTKVEEKFNMPTAEIPAITYDDHYNNNASYIEYQDNRIDGASILTNDKNKKVGTDKNNNTSIKATVTDNIAIIENENVKKNQFDDKYKIYKNGQLQGELTVNNDGTFSFVPEPGITGEVIFTYKIVTSINPYNEKSKVESNVSNVTLLIKEHEKRNISVNKEWDDNNNQDGYRTNQVIVKLFANNVDTQKTLILNANNKWSDTFKDVRTYDDNHDLITYTVKEEKVDNYQETITGNMENGFKIVNKHTVEKIKVEGKKVWDDSNNQDGVRPSTITLELTGTVNNQEVIRKTIELRGTTNEWPYEFNNLDKKKDGKEIIYKIKELNVDKNYTVEISNNIITNKHAVEKIDVLVDKKWVDNNNQDGIRPKSINVKLFADGEYTGKSISLTDDNQWSGIFENVNKYKEGSKGQKIVYTVQEDIPTGYENKVVSSTDAAGNTLENAWTIVNTHNPKQRNIKVIKKWDDNNNQDGYRSESVEIALFDNKGDMVPNTQKTLSANNNWEYEYTNLDEYNNGSLNVYNVKELNANSNYSVNYTGNNSAEITITNKHTIDTINISVYKTWDDNNNQDGYRSDEVTVKLLADGQDTGKSLKLNNANSWNSTFENLEKFKAGAVGKEIVYSIEEVQIENYESNYEQQDTTSQNDIKYQITNVHTPEVITYNVTKVWNDNENQDGIRPDSITVRLFADGVEIESQTISEENGWTYTFEDLYRFSNGKEINYTIVEDDVKGYTTIINRNTKDDDNNLNTTITNSHEVEKTDITVNKKWEDYDDKLQLRPDSIVVNLYENGELIEEVEITEADNWTHTFKDLDVYKDGVKINYSITENEVENYTSEIDNFTITNTIKEIEGDDIEISPPITGYTGNNNLFEIIMLMVMILSSSLVLKCRRD